MVKLVVLGVLVGLAAAIKFLPWWASVALVAGVVLSAKTIGGWLVKRFAMGLFDMKSRVLRGARVRIHAVTPAEPPKPDEDFHDDELAAALEEERGPRHWLHVDLSLDVPEPAADAELACWDPWDLVLVPPGTPPGMPDEDGEDEIGEVHGVEVRDAKGRWVAAEDKLAGSQRLRLHVGIAERGLPFRFRYFFEVLEQSEDPGSAA